MKKNIVKIIIAILVVILVVFVGVKLYEANVEIKPKDLIITNHDGSDSVTAEIGTYNWSRNGKYVVADSISAQDMEYMQVLNVKKNEKIYFSNYDWTKSSAVIILKNNAGEAVQLVIDSNPEECSVTIPNISGTQILQIDLESPKGKVWYSAKVNVIE